MSVIEAAHRFGAPAPPKLAVVRSAERPPDQGVDRLIEAFIKSRRMQATRDTYRRDIAGSPNRRADSAMTYLEYLSAKGIDFFSAPREVVDDWLLYMEGRGLSEATRARRIAAVSGLYTYGVTDWTGRPAVNANPAKGVKRPRVGDNVQYSGLSTDQIRAMLRAAESREYRRADRNWPRTSAIASVLIHTGVRRDELVTADVASVGTERSHRILHVVRKGGLHQGIVLPPQADETLTRYLGGRTTGPLLMSEDGKRLDGSGVYRAIRSLGDFVFPGQEYKVHPHDMRHSCATLLYELGASDWEVQTILGHADVRTTRRYNHARLALDESPLYRLGTALA